MENIYRFLFVDAPFALLLIIIIITLIVRAKKNVAIRKSFTKHHASNNYDDYDNDYENSQPESHLPSVDEAVFESPSHFYWRKNSCMTPNESLMFFYINCALDNLLQPKLRKYYYVFPQVSLYSIIGISDRTLSEDELFAARKNLLKKNADFIICHCTWKNLKSSTDTNNRSGFYAYEPVLWVELDGSSHVSGQKYGWTNFFDQQKRDTFKDRLAQQLGLPILRYTIASDTLSPDDKKQLEAKIADILHFEKSQNTEQV